MVTVIARWQRHREQVGLPVLMKEMRSRLRGAQAQWLILLATALAVLVALLIVVPQWDELATGNPASLARGLAEIGKTLFVGLMILEMALCGIIVPALTAGAISLEREQQTLEMLLLTRLSSASIILGKYLSALSFLLLVVTCTLPVAAVSFLLGGIDPGLLLWFTALLLSLIAVGGALGLLCSAIMRKTAAAVATAYLCCLAWVALLPATLSGLTALTDRPPAAQWEFLAVFAVVCLVGLCMALPTGLISLLTSVCLRRPLPTLANVGLWLLLTLVGISVTLAAPAAVNSGLEACEHAIWVGNPFMALGVLIAQAWGGAGHVLSSQWDELIVPLTVGVNLLAAALFLATAARWLRRAMPSRG